MSVQCLRLVQNSTCQPFSTIRNVQFDLKTARKVKFDQNLARKEPHDLAKCIRNLSSEVEQVPGASKLIEEVATAAPDLAVAPELVYENPRINFKDGDLGLEYEGISPNGDTGIEENGDLESDPEYFAGDLVQVDPRTELQYLSMIKERETMTGGSELNFRPQCDQQLVDKRAFINHVKRVHLCLNT